jgi:hypothetical protein
MVATPLMLYTVIVTERKPVALIEQRGDAVLLFDESRIIHKRSRLNPLCPEFPLTDANINYIMDSS